jgi:hypothetical protein
MAGQGEKGKICRICEAKYILAQTYLPQKQELQFLEKHVAQNTREESLLLDEVSTRD